VVLENLNLFPQGLPPHYSLNQKTLVWSGLLYTRKKRESEKCKCTSIQCFLFFPKIEICEKGCGWMLVVGREILKGIWKDVKQLSDNSLVQKEPTFLAIKDIGTF
jgi:hypothetical protein